MAIHDQYYTQTFRTTHGFHGLNASREQAAFVAAATPLRPEQDILDLGCGFGRHTLELAALGYRVTGLDQSADFLTEARQAAATGRLDVPFVQADMRQLDYVERFDVVLSLSTSLAFYDDATNHNILGRVVRALRPGGTFFFDQGNLFWLVKNHVPERYAFDARTCIVSARFSKDTAAGPVEAGWDLRFYHLPELRALLGSLGLVLGDCYGDFDGSPFDYASRRLITVWHKRAASQVERSWGSPSFQGEP